MMILDVQAVVKQPRESTAQNNLQSKTQSITEKRNNFARHLKKLIQKEANTSSSQPCDSIMSGAKGAKTQEIQETANNVEPDGVQDVPNQTPVQGNVVAQNQAEPDADKSSGEPIRMDVCPDIMALKATEPVSGGALPSQIMEELAVAVSVEIPADSNLERLETSPTPMVESDTSTLELEGQKLASLTKGFSTDVQSQSTEAIPAILTDERNQAKPMVQQPAAPFGENATVPAADILAASTQICEDGSTVPLNGPSQNNLAVKIDSRVSSPIALETQTRSEKSSSAITDLGLVTPIEETQEQSVNASLVISDEELSTPVKLETRDTPVVVDSGSLPEVATEAQDLSANAPSGAEKAQTARDTKQIEAPLNPTIILEAKNSSKSDTEEKKKSTDTDEKTSIKLRLLEKPLLEQAVKQTEEPVKNDVKKIIDIESQRLTGKKIPNQLILSENVQDSKVADVPTQSLNPLDRITVEQIKTGLDAGKTLLENANLSGSSPEEILDQIVQKVEMVSKQVGSEMKIHLKPEILGEMIIKVAVENGVVTARFYTENQHVKQVLEANMSSLKQSLEANGLRVDKTEVNVQLDNGGSFHGSNENTQQLWQEMNSQGRSSNHYSPYNGGGAGELEELAASQPMADNLNTLGEGQVDFII